MNFTKMRDEMLKYMAQTGEIDSKAPESPSKPRFNVTSGVAFNSPINGPRGSNTDPISLDTSGIDEDSMIEITNWATDGGSMLDEYDFDDSDASSVDYSIDMDIVQT